MDPPPPPPPLSTTTNATQLGYPDSVESSPRSRNTDSWDEPLPPVPGAKMRLMCSFGGHIVPRPHDKSLCYLGGETRIIVVDRISSLSELSLRLSRNLLNNRSFTLKYQLPNEDLDSLISVTTDEDLENMIEEYDRTSSPSSNKPSRLRLFLFPTKPDTSSSIGSLLDDSKSENWFVEALNGAGFLPRGVSADGASVNCLLGLDDDVLVRVDGSSSSVDVEPQNDSLGNINKQLKSNQDVHSVPDSPMLETNSSFGSSSSSPSMANLPPIRVHVEDRMVGLEEHFSHINVTNVTAQKQDERFVLLSSPPPLPTTTGVPSVVSENPNRVSSDSELSDQGGVPTGFRKPPQPPSSQQLLQKTSDGIDIPSPDGNKRDPNVVSRTKPMFYQDPSVQVASRDNRVHVNLIDPKLSDPTHRFLIQKQGQDSGYVLNSQLDQHQHQQLQQQQQQQYIHGGTHYIHHQPTGQVPMSSYYPMHPQQQQQQQQQYDQNYPMYFVPVRQSQPYNFSMQSSYGDTNTISSTRTPTPPNPSMLPTPTVYKERSAPPPPKPELVTNVYRTAAPTPPQLVQMPTEQQNLGYAHQMHHPSQSIANYGYEFTDPSHTQIYYTQPLGATLPSQYQTMSAAAVVAASEASGQLQTGNTK